jgi:hypothetical protein
MAVEMPEMKMWTRSAVLLAFALALSACGMGGAARVAQQTGAKFDKYGCLAAELKGEKPCEQTQ